MKIISLGGRCETRWQIDHFVGEGKYPTYPFDWLVSPFESISHLIDSRLKGIAESDNLEISTYIVDRETLSKKETIYNKKYKIFLHHEFERDVDGFICKDWRDHIPKVKDKFDFLTDRFFMDLSENSKIIFLRRRGAFSMPDEVPHPVSNAMVAKLYSSLKNNTEKPYLAICDEVIKTRNPYIITGLVGEPSNSDWEDQNDSWKGATQAWQNFIRTSIERRSKPIYPFPLNILANYGRKFKDQ